MNDERARVFIDCYYEELIDLVKGGLAAQDLYVISAADKAVLDAMAKVHPRALKAACAETHLADACAAELARRKATR